MGVINSNNVANVDNMVVFSLKREEAKRLIEYIQAVRDKSIYMEAYLQNVFDTIFQDVCQVQEMSAEINALIYEGLTDTYL
jgi:hypothetical protein